MSLHRCEEHGCEALIAWKGKCSDHGGRGAYHLGSPRSRLTGEEYQRSLERRKRKAFNVLASRRFADFTAANGRIPTVEERKAIHAEIREARPDLALPKETARCSANPAPGRG